MIKLLIVAAFAACCLATPQAPTPNNRGEVVKPQDLRLKRPSPINPNVLSDPKPAESIVVFTDPKAIAKQKRETGNVKPVTTRHDVHEHSNDQHQPQQQNKQQQQPSKQKREDVIHPSKPVSNPESVFKTPSTTAPQANRRQAQPDPPKMSSSPTAPKHRQRREEGAQTQQHTTEPVPLIHRGEYYHGQEGHVAPQTLPAHTPALEHDTHSQGSVRLQTLPLSAHKRDIPVPLVAKHPQATESPKVEEHRNAQKPQNDRRDQHIELEDPNMKAPQTMHSSAEHADLAPHDFQPSFHHHDLQQPHPHSEQSHEGTVTQSRGATSDNPLSASTAEHPAIRHHPVPVAELFARPKQQATAN